MKKISLLFLLFISLQVEARNLLKYKDPVDLEVLKGRTFLSLMKSEIKPALDQKAREGFQVVSGADVARFLKSTDSKVAQKAIRSAGSLENLTALADQLHESGLSYRFYDLPQVIAKAGYPQGRYDLTTFLSLVSGGGVAVRIDSENIAYNVNYGTGEQEKDERTGRSFGEAPSRKALDASDKHYLETLEAYVRGEPENMEHFFRSLLSVLMNSDSSGYQKISKAGQAVATDFLAVYIAEQNRHLMSDFRNHPWEEALLEVTLLSSFHAGQKTVHVMSGGDLTATTFRQRPGCDTGEKVAKSASLVDYWQFSTNTDPAHCNRSGINITRRDFRALGALITGHMRETHPELVRRIETKLGLKEPSANLYASLSKFMIRLEAPETFNSKVLGLIGDYVEFLMAVSAEAQAITEAGK